MEGDAKRSVSGTARWPWPRGAWALAAALVATAAPAGAMTLDAVYGGMAKGCTYDQDANYRIIMAYVDEGESGPKLARPDGGKRLAAFLGRARLRWEGESYTLEIPVTGATLYGLPVSQLAPYRGNRTDIAGVAITFALPLGTVKARLARAGVKLVPHNHGWGDIEPMLEPVKGNAYTQLTCDLSM